MGIENQWTYLKLGSKEENEKAWQVGFFEEKGLTIVGCFDHILINNQETTGLTEGDGPLEQDSFEDDRLLTDAIKALIPDDTYIYSVILPHSIKTDLANGNFIRPPGFSLVKWIFAPRYKKWKIICWEKIVKDGVHVISFLDEDFGCILLGFDKEKKWIDSYFQRFGDEPDAIPDLLYLSYKPFDADSLKKEINLSFLYDNLYYQRCENFSRRYEFENLMHNFWGVLWSLDGHIYFASHNSSRDEMVHNLDAIAQKYDLTIAKDHILY